MKHGSQIKFVLIGLVLTIMSVGCQDSEESNQTQPKSKQDDPKQIRANVEQEIGLGELNGKTYTNNYFNLKITFPKSWHLRGQAERKYTENLAKQFLRNPESGNRKTLEAAKAGSLTLVSVSRFAPGTTRPPGAPRINCNMSISAMRVAHLPGVKTGADYLRNIQRGFRSKVKMQAAFQPIRHGQAIGSWTADCLSAELHVKGIKVNMRIYATRVRDYILVVSMNYNTPQDLQTLEGLRKSIKDASSPTAVVNTKNPDAPEWRAFNQSDFTADFPGAVRTIVRNKRTRTGTRKFAFHVAETSSGAVFGLSHYDIPAAVLQAKGIKKTLDDSRNGGLRGNKGRLSSEKSITLGKHPGREYRYSFMQKGVRTFGVARIILVHNCMYQLLVVRPFEMADQKRVDRFFKSFALLKK